MSITTILKKLSEKEDLIVVPRGEYEVFLKFKKIKTFTPTPAHKRALARSIKNLKEGKTLSFEEFTRKLGIKD
ncbi:MAG: hypothetical protein Q8Q95_04235 [bacterium]|nr:hypothetical protein [bacterium]